jgi:heme/copper-type cytochrome/quinol oxidase subunit 2
MHPAAVILSTIATAGCALALTQAALMPCDAYDAERAAGLLLAGWLLAAAGVLIVLGTALWPLLARREARLRDAQRMRDRNHQQPRPH